MDDLFNILFSNSDDDSDKEKIADLDISRDRKLMTGKLVYTLKKQFFFTDDEIKPVVEILDNYFLKVDEINNSVDYKNYGLISSQKMETDLLTIQKEMLKTLREKIKETMKHKVEEAKEFFKNNPDKLK